MMISICMVASDCPPNLKCFDGICVVGCTDDSECRDGERCNGRYCYQAWCQEDGNCPDGWSPIDGSLYCSYQG